MILWLTSGPKEGAGWPQNHWACAEKNPHRHRLLFLECLGQGGNKLMDVVTHLFEPHFLWIVEASGPSLTLPRPSAPKGLSSFLSFWMRLTKADPLTNLRSMVRLEKINIYWYICVFMDLFADCVSVPASWGTCGGQGTRSKSYPSPPTI